MGLAITWHQGARITRECLGYHHLVQWHGDIDDEGKPVVHCDDEPNSCGYAICLAERQFALDVKTLLSNNVGEYNSAHRKLNGFDRIAECQGSAAQFDMHATEWLPGRKNEEVQTADEPSVAELPTLHINTVDEATTQNNPTNLEVASDDSSTPAADVQTPMETSSRTDVTTEVGGAIWDATTDITTNREIQSEAAATEANTPEIVIATDAPTPATEAPTAPPTAAPTAPPTAAPTAPPTEAPTAPPTAAPTAAPTEPPTPAQTFPVFNDYDEDSNGDTGDNRATTANAVAPDMIIFNDQPDTTEVVTQPNPVITERSTAPNDQQNGDGTAFNVATDASTQAPTNAPATDAPVVATDAPAATNPPAAPETNAPVATNPPTAPPAPPATNAPAAPVVNNVAAQTPEPQMPDFNEPVAAATEAPTAAPTAAPNNQASGATQSNESQQSIDTTTLRLASTGAFNPATVLNMDADATVAEAAAATNTVAQVTQSNANAAVDTVIVAEPVLTLTLENRLCCGQYPSRFKYNQNSKNCCANTKVYSEHQHVCCENDSTLLKPLGSSCNSKK